MITSPKRAQRKLRRLESQYESISIKHPHARLILAKITSLASRILNRFQKTK